MALCSYVLYACICMYVFMQVCIYLPVYLWIYLYFSLSYAISTKVVYFAATCTNCISALSHEIPVPYHQMNFCNFAPSFFFCSFFLYKSNRCFPFTETPHTFTALLDEHGTWSHEIYFNFSFLGTLLFLLKCCPLASGEGGKPV